jgi:septal ring factor EnvC (AmiA/AmiB activator)
MHLKQYAVSSLFSSLLIAALAMTAFSQSAMARSILPEQNDAAAARDAVGDSMSKLDDLNKRIKSQEELIAREQERLQQYQNEKAQTERDLEARKAVFEQKSKVLDEAWKDRSSY